MIAATNPAGYTTEYSYDPMGQLKSIKTPDGAATSMTYDKLGRLTKTTDALGNETGYLYNFLGLPAEVTDPLGNKTTFNYDPNGNLLSSADPTGAVITYEYDSMGRTISMTNALGGTTSYEYDSLGRVIKMTDTQKAEYLYEYDQNGNLIKQTDPLKNTYTTDYDENGNPVLVTDPMGNSSSYAYDLLGRVVEQTDRRGAKAEFSYDPAGNVISKKLPDGSTYKYEYDLAGRLLLEADPLERNTHYSYNRAGQLEETLNAASGLTTYQYDANGRIIKQTDESGNATSFKYDLSGNVVEQTDPLGRTTYCSYDALGNLKDITDPRGAKTSYTYDARKELMAVTGPRGGQTSYSYDPAGNLTETTDPLGNKTTYKYDLLSRLTSTTDPRGAVTSYSYDPIGRVTSATDALGGVTAYDYDAVGRVVKTTDPLGNAYETVYDEESNPISQKDPLGRIASNSYDLMGRLIESVDAMGNKSMMSYDAAGNMVKYTDAMGADWSYSYDALNRLVSESNPSGNTTTYEYDPVGNLLKTSDPLTHTTSYVYDAASQLTQVTDALGNITKYDYDASGNLSEVTDANGNKTQYQADLSGNPMSETDALGHAKAYSYDLANRLSSETNASGQTTAYRYDAVGNLVGTDYFDGTNDSFTYDLSGRITDAKNKDSSLSFTYDVLGRLASQTDNLLEKTTSFSYDALGNRTSVTDPEGRVMSYIYNDNNLIKTMADPDGNITLFNYDALGREVLRMLPNRVSIATSYDSDGNVSSIVNKGAQGILSSFAYEYDAAGNKISQAEEDGALTTYGYDALNRITHVEYPIDKINAIRNKELSLPERLSPVDTGSGTAQDQTVAPSASQEESDNSSRGNGKKPLSFVLDRSNLVSMFKYAQGNGNGNNGSNGNGNGNSNGNGNGSGNGNSGTDNGNNNSNGNNGNGNGNGNGYNNGNGNGGGNGNGNGAINGKGNGKGNGNGSNPNKKPKPWEVQPSQEDVGLGYTTISEQPDYLMDPTSFADYAYDAVGNRTSLTTDYGTVSYAFDAANRLISDGQKEYQYDADGNLVKTAAGNYEVKYGYTPAGMLESVDYADGSYVSYKYDAFGRKIGRTEAYYAKNSEFVPPGQQKESKSNGNGKGNSIKNSDSFGKGNSNSQGNGNAYGQGNGNAYGQGNGNGNNKPLKLETDTTLYSYDGLGVNVLNEYTGNGAPLGEYYYAGQSIIGKKMFGNHGLDGRGPDLQTTGGLMYYQYDGLQNVSSLTNRLGEVIEDYRYDVFGNLYTGITAPYNTYGFTGMEYDPKAGLVNMHARWYAPDTGRFITPDSYSGDLMQPYTQNLYAYVGNNPVNRWDPLGYAESDMGSVWFENNSLSNGFETYAYEKVRYWTDSSNYSDTTKGSDGWYTSWMNSLYEYWLYNVYYSRAEYTGESTPDFGKSYDIVESRTYQTTFSQTSVSYGTNFTPFTSKEWYEEHKDDLISHGPLPSSTPSWLTKTISSASFKYNSFNPSSGTDVLFSKTSTGTTNAQKPQVSIIQGLLNKALNNDTLKTDGLYGRQTQKAVTEFQKEYGLKVSGKVDEATMAKLLYIGTTQQSKVAQNLTAHKAEDALSLQKFSAKYSTQGTVYPGGHDPDDPAFNQGTSKPEPVNGWAALSTGSDVAGEFLKSWVNQKYYDVPFSKSFNNDLYKKAVKEIYAYSDPALNKIYGKDYGLYTLGPKSAQKELNVLTKGVSFAKGIAVIGFVANTFSEYDTSRKAWENTTWNGTAKDVLAAADAATYGFARGILKTPSLIADLDFMPQGVKDFSKSYQKWVDNNINAPAIADKIITGVNAVGNAITNVWNSIF